jgi:hypothetical protein
MSIIGLGFWSALAGAFAIKDSQKLKKQARNAIRSYGKGKAPVREYIIACHYYKKYGILQKELFRKYYLTHDAVTAYRMASKYIKDKYTGGVSLEEWAIAQARMKMIRDGYIPSNVFGGGLDEKMLQSYNPYTQIGVALRPDIEPNPSKTKGLVYNDIVFDDE